MLDFHTYMMRYGEAGVQALVERMERHENIRRIVPMTLEKRWAAVMHDEAGLQRQAA